jgi:hypothetical protein
MLGRLVERVGGRAGAIYALGPSGATVGRDAENDIVLADERVSRQHLRVQWNGMRYILEDLGSRNGVYVNGIRVVESLPLQHGDIVIVAGLTFLFELQQETVDWVPEMSPVPELQIDSIMGRVWARGQEIKLAAKEYLALLTLYNRRGALVSKDELAAFVWPEYKGDVGNYNIEKTITRLRHKIELDPTQPQHLITVRKLGYRLDGA